VLSRLSQRTTSATINEERDVALRLFEIRVLGSSVLFIPAIFVLALGFTLQAGATGAVKAIKMSAHLVAGGAGTSEIAVGADARRGAPPS
jgi:hypothetical protein